MWCNGAMPWCRTCDRFLSPPTVRADGACPWCGGIVEPGRAHAHGAVDTTPTDEPYPPAPWHLKLLAGALAVYLGYRAWQGVEWVVHKL